jgi:hypothetical protein
MVLNRDLHEALSQGAKISLWECSLHCLKCTKSNICEKAVNVDYGKEKDVARPVYDTSAIIDWSSEWGLHLLLMVYCQIYCAIFTVYCHCRNSLVTSVSHIATFTAAVVCFDYLSILPVDTTDVALNMAYYLLYNAHRSVWLSCISAKTYKRWQKYFESWYCLSCFIRTLALISCRLAKQYG